MSWAEYFVNNLYFKKIAFQNDGTDTTLKSSENIELLLNNEITLIEFTPFLNGAAGFGTGIYSDESLLQVSHRTVYKVYKNNTLIYTASYMSGSSSYAAELSAGAVYKITATLTELGKPITIYGKAYILGGVVDNLNRYFI